MQLTPADLLIFAPHPDDESVGAAGVIQQAIGAGRSVRVVFVTSGDGYPQAASALFKKPVHELQRDDFVSLAGTRQLEAVAAATVLGLSPSDVLFLGYPDAALSAVCANESGASIVSPFTERQAT